MNKISQLWLYRFATYSTLTACFLVLLTTTLFATNAQRMLTLWGDEIQLSAYLEEGLEHEQIKQIEQKISLYKEIGKIEYIEKEKALDQFSAQMASFAPDLSGDKDLLNLIPPSFQLTLSHDLEAGKQEQTLRDLALDLTKIEGIEEVRYGQEWIKKYSSILKFSQTLFLVLGLTLIFASLFVIGNSIRMNIETRREEIEVLELLGAPPLRLRKPFIIEGALQGFVATLTAIVICLLFFYAGKNYLAEEMQAHFLAQHLAGFSILQSLMILLTGTGLGALAAYLCVWKLNTGYLASGAKS